MHPLAKVFLAAAVLFLLHACAVRPVGGPGVGNVQHAVCHKGKTLYVDGNALKAHLGHGDTPGVCP